MKTLCQWFAQVGFLPEWQWFRRMMVKNLVRKTGRGYGGVIDLGDVTHEQYVRFRDWWERGGADL